MAEYKKNKCRNNPKFIMQREIIRNAFLCTVLILLSVFCFGQTVLAGTDTVSPEVTSIEPVNDINGVPISAAIHIKFSENVQPGDAYNNIALKNGGNIVSITCSLNQSILIIKPESKLDYKTAYTVSLPAGAVKDSAGNALSTNFTATFTTQEAPASPTPTTSPTSKTSQLSPTTSSTTGSMQTQITSTTSLQTASHNVAVLDESYNDSGIYAGGVGYMYPKDYPNQTFSELNSTAISSAVLQNYDTLLLFMFNPSSLTTIQRQDIVNWVNQGGKLIIWDSDESTGWDYTWLPYPFVSSVPGAQGAFGQGLQIAEENQLSSSDPSSPYYINTTVLNSQTDATGDANVMVTYGSGWFIDMIATNVLGQRGPVHAYAPYGSGLIIYCALDWDCAGYGSGWNYNQSGTWLKKILQQEFNVSPGATTLPRTISGKDAVDAISRNTFDEIQGNYGESYVAEPVNTATGAHVLERTLLQANGAQPLSFKAHYNSLLLDEGPLGKGWGHNFETSAEVLSTGDVVIHWDANRKNTFIKYGTNQFAPQDLATRFDTLVKNADGSYTLTRKDQSVYNFNVAGQLIQQQNGHGQSFAMTYDSSGHLATITEPVSGQAIAMHYNTSGLIQSATDNSNRQVIFNFDAGHNLTGITDAAGQNTTYTYNTDGRVLTAADAAGVQVFSNTYDAQGRVASQDDAVATNQVTRFSYDETSQPGKIITTVTDRNGQTRVFTHDTNYKLLSVKDELGNTTTSAYDSSGNRTSATDAGGNTTTFTYDASGNMLTATDPAGHITRMTYDSKNNLLSAENTLGKRITFTYDSNNNITAIADPVGNTTTYTYDTNGLMLTKTTPGSGTTTYTYQNGLPHSATDPAGNTVTYGYDADGRPVTVTDAAGKTTTLSYDAADNLTSVADPLNNTMKFTYDCRHNRLTETDANSNLTRFSYNGNGKLTGRTDALNNQTRYEYDGEDRLTRVIDARGNATTLSYDAKGRVTGITDPLGNTATLQYNVLDNLAGVKDALGRQILSISYDSLNNPLTVTDALGHAVTNQYDALSRLSSLTDPLGRITRFNYDDLNRLTSTSDALSGQSRQTFDADGNRAALVDPNSNQTSFSFDNAGRLTAKTTEAGNVTTYGYNAQNLLSKMTNGRGQSTSYQYDDAGRLVSFTDPAGTVTCTYDANGNVLTTSDSTGTSTRAYDALNRVVKYTDVQGNVIQYAYDAVGNLVTLTYPGGKQAQYGYDAANRLTSVTDWAGRVTTYQYDANSRMVKTLSPDGTALTRSYDAAGQLLQQKDVDKSGSVISQYDYTYDAAGNVTAEQPSIASQPFTLPNAAMTYTSDNRLATFNGQPVSYDADGNMTAGPLAGQMGSYAYDARNRLTSAGNTSYQYDAENHRISVTDSVYQTQTRYVINPNSILNQVLIKSDAQNNQTFYIYGLGLIGQEENGSVYRTYHYDRRGSTIALTDESGKVTDCYQYSPYGTLVSRTGNTSTPFLYNGRYGVMTDANGLYYMRARYYNPEIRRFINQDILLGNIVKGQSLNRYTYVNGQPVSYVDPFGLSPDEAGFGLGDAASIGLDLIPGVGNVKSLIQVFTGTDIITGREESRWMSAIGAVPFLGNTVKIVKEGKAAFKIAEEVVDVAKRLDVPASLLTGPADTYIYKGVINGVDDYAGVTNNVVRRASEHGERFTEVRAISEEPLTRGQARAIEQALIEDNPQFSNIRNSISPLRSWYEEAVGWGKDWLRERGLLGE